MAATLTRLPAEARARPAASQPLRPRIIRIACRPAAATKKPSDRDRGCSPFSLRCTRCPWPADLSGPLVSPTADADAGCNRPLRQQRAGIKIGRALRLQISAALLLALLLLQLQLLPSLTAVAAGALSAPPLLPPATFAAAAVGSWPPALATIPVVAPAAETRGQWSADPRPAALSEWPRLQQRDGSGALTQSLPPLLSHLRQLESLLALPPWPPNAPWPLEGAVVAAAAAGPPAALTSPFSGGGGSSLDGLLLPLSAAGAGPLTGPPPIETLLANPALLFQSGSGSAADFTAASGGALGSGGSDSGGVAVRRGIDWAALGIGSEQYEAAALAVRLSILLQLATYINFAGRETFVAATVIISGANNRNQLAAGLLVGGVALELATASRIFQGSAAKSARALRKSRRATAWLV